jgi:hypothetical protein
MFIARISRGRTIRQFVGGVILVPSTVSLVWFAVFGGTAMRLQERERLGDETTPEGQLFGRGPGPEAGTEPGPADESGNGDEPGTGQGSQGS